MSRVKAELEVVARAYGALEVGPNEAWFIVEKLVLPTGWSLPSTPLLVLIPSGYPVTPPDNFYVSNELKLAGGKEPTSTQPSQTQAGRLWRMFSWHIDGAWKSSSDHLQGDNLLTFLLKCRERLSELN